MKIMRSIGLIGMVIILGLLCVPGVIAFDSVTVPADKPDPVYTQQLEKEKYYELEVSGVFSVWDDHTDGVDAYYCYGEWRCPNGPEAWKQLLVNDIPMADLDNSNTIAKYNPQHIYRASIMGQGKPLKLQISDASWSSQGNQGSLEVKISEKDANSCQAECKGRDLHLIWNGKNEYPYCNCICENGWEFDANGKNCVPSAASNTNANPCQAECKERDIHLIWNGKDEYPYCNCVCEDGWEFDADGKKCVRITSESGAGSKSDILVQTASGTTVLKPGDSVPVPSTLSAKCEQLFDLIELSWDGNLLTTIFSLAASEKRGRNLVWPGLPTPLITKYLFAMSICAGDKAERLVTKTASDSPVLLGSPGSSESSAQIELGLQQGPLRAEVVNDRVSLSVKTDTATVASYGKNTFGVAYDPTNGTTIVAAYQGPVSVQPTNSNLAPFTLGAGQIVDVSAEGVGPAVSLAQLGTNGTAPGSGATGITGTGNATTTGISAPGGPSASGASGTGTSAVSPSGNNQIGDTADINAGQSVSQTISPAGSSNFYRFQADSSGIVKMKLENVPKDMRPYLCLYDKNLAPISEKSASNPGDTLNLEKDVQGPGQFYIEAKDIDGKAHSEPYTLNVAFEPAPDQYEPNPNYFRATDVKSGENINAYICPGSDEDFYKIFVDTSGILKLKMEDVPADMRPYLQLVDMGLGNSIASNSASNPGDKVKLEKDVQGPGWFYIRVQDADGKAHSEPYTLTVAL